MGLSSISTIAIEAGLGASTGTSCPDDGKGGSSRIGSKASSGGLETVAAGFLGLSLFLAGLGVVQRGLSRSPGLSPRDPSEGVVERSLFRNLLDGPLVHGDQPLLSSTRVDRLFHLSCMCSLVLCSLSYRQSCGSRDAVGGCKAWLCWQCTAHT